MSARASSWRKALEDDNQAKNGRPSEWQWCPLRIYGLTCAHNALTFMAAAFTDYCCLPIKHLPTLTTIAPHVDRNATTLTVHQCAHFQRPTEVTGCARWKEAGLYAIKLSKELFHLFKPLFCQRIWL